jgi:hypothetical protein
LGESTSEKEDNEVADSNHTSSITTPPKSEPLHSGGDEFELGEDERKKEIEGNQSKFIEKVITRENHVKMWRIVKLQTRKLEIQVERQIVTPKRRL